MKIKSLILGSVAAAALSSAPLAAGIEEVLTSLDVCDAQGITGLTLSSEENCLQISGGVAYAFKWGDYNGSQIIVNNFARNAANATIPDNDGVAPYELDWDSNVDAWLKFVGTADSSWGPASATIKLDWDADRAVNNEGMPAFVVATHHEVNPNDTTSEVLRVEEAYVSIGDTTVLMAGRKGSVANFKNDEPLNWLGLFNSSNVDKGVGFSVALPTGGDVIQVTADLGNGVSVAGGLENLNGTVAQAGTAVGVIAYSGNGVDANVTVLAGGILDGTVENWAIQAGIKATLDMVTLVGAIAADNAGYWNVLASASLEYDMFTLAGSVEATSGNEVGFGVSGSAEVSTGVTINAGFRWFDTNTLVANDEGYQAAVQLVAAVTETVTLTGEIGIYGVNTIVPTNTAYGAATVAWAPGGGFTSSVKGDFYANGAYSLTFKAAKNFE